jgi:hypothetical protein
MQCPVCGQQVWNYQQGVFRCPSNHLTMEGEADNTGRTLIPLEDYHSLAWVGIAVGAVSGFVTGIVLGGLFL